MVLLRSYVLLRVARETVKSTNFVSQQICRPSGIAKYFSNEACKDQIVDTNTNVSSEAHSIGYADNGSQANKTSVNNVRVTNSFALQEYNDALDGIETQKIGALDTCTEDVSYIGPYYTPFFTFSKYANKSETIKQLVHLGVRMYEIEKDNEVSDLLLKLDFNKDIKPYIQFLHDCKLPADRLGNFISKFPRIIMEDMDNLKKRIMYLSRHEFTETMIQKILNDNPRWLSFPINEIDSRLGYFQRTLKLEKSQVRHVATKCPKLITTNMFHLREMTHCVTKEMCFDDNQRRSIIVKTPYVWIKSRLSVVGTFDYAVYTMKLSHDMISKHPKILLCRKQRLERRHKFLTELKKDQFDPAKPLYISPTALVAGNDIEFCLKIAKTTVYTYELFLKTL